MASLLDDWVAGASPPPLGDDGAAVSGDNECDAGTPLGDPDIFALDPVERQAARCAGGWGGWRGD